MTACPTLMGGCTIKCNIELFVQWCLVLLTYVLFNYLQGSNDTTFICANDNGKIVFFGAVLSNGQLIKQDVSSVFFFISSLQEVNWGKWL